MQALQIPLSFQKQETYVNLDFLSAMEDACDADWWAGREEKLAESNYSKTILSLFDYTGNWARPYVDAGYDVHCFDIKNGHDINDFCVEYLIEELGIESVHGVLAAVPCTDFCVSGARWFAEKDKSGKTKSSIELMNQTIRTIELFAPYWFAIENPVGRIARLFPALNVKPWYFNPCDFAKDRPNEAYTKKTGLHGVFTPPTAVNLGRDLSVHPHLGSKMHRLGGKSERTKELRSTTPIGFAEAFYECNP